MNFISLYDDIREAPNVVGSLSGAGVMNSAVCTNIATQAKLSGTCHRLTL